MFVVEVGRVAADDDDDDDKGRLAEVHSGSAATNGPSDNINGGLDVCPTTDSGLDRRLRLVSTDCREAIVGKGFFPSHTRRCKVSLLHAVVYKTIRRAEAACFALKKLTL